MNYNERKLEIINRRIAELENQIANSEQIKKENVGKPLVELNSHMTEKQIVFYTELLEDLKTRKTKIENS